MSQKKQNDSQQEAAVLVHLARYRLTVFEAAAGVVRPRGLARRVLARLAESGLLASAPLYRNRRYWHLTQSGATRLGTALDDSGEPLFGPLSEAAKIRAYAMLAFCCLGDISRDRLTRRELQRHFADLDRPGLPLNYYVDGSRPKPQLGFLRVDTGGHGRWDRIVEKVRHDAESHWLMPGFRRLITAGCFEITLVAALAEKAERIRRELAEGRIARPVQVRVVAMPDLVHLVMPAALPVAVQPANQPLRPRRF